MKTRAVIAWTLYDFANSSFAAVIMATIYSTYYALMVVGNQISECFTNRSAWNAESPSGNGRSTASHDSRR